MKYSNKFNLPQSIYDAVVKETYDVRQDDPKVLSVTSLIDEPKAVVLRKRHFGEIHEDASDNVWRLLGSSVHVIVGQIAPKDRIIERRFSQERGGFTITGKPDLYDTPIQELDDYKVTSVWAFIHNQDGKKEWVRQLNVYAWLLRAEGLPVKALRNILILRDWSRTDARKDTSYPQIPIQIVDIPLYEQATIEAFIDMQIKRHTEAMALPDDEIPICKPESRWHGDDTWAVYKDQKQIDKGGRANRVFDKEEDARSQARQMVPHGVVQHRQAEDRRCKDYCPVKKWCNFGRERYPEEGEANEQKPESM